MLYRFACFCFLLAFLANGNRILANGLSPAPTVPLIRINGNSYNRGLQHGKILKKEIGSVYAKWKQNIEAITKENPDSILNAFRSYSAFEPAIQKYTPDILKELKGIADGSGQQFKDVYAFQLLDEFWVWLDKRSHETEHHCSAIGVPATASHPAFIAQNIDLENYMQGFQVLFHISPSANEPEQYIITCAGLIALAGMNENGIGLCLNSLMELNASADGLPVAFVIRAVLSKKSGHDALDFIQKIKHASGQNYILGIGDSVYNFEASANQVKRFIPPSNQQIVYHTNHALVNHDVKPWFSVYHEQVLNGSSKNRNSESRFTSLEQRLNMPADKIDPDLIKATLRSKDNSANPVCRTYRQNGGGFTFSSVIFTLGQNMFVELTYASPDQSEYIEYRFSSRL